MIRSAACSPPGRAAVFCGGAWNANGFQRQEGVDISVDTATARLPNGGRGYDPQRAQQLTQQGKASEEWPMVENGHIQQGFHP